MTEGGLKRRDTAVSGITWQGFSFGTLVEVAVQGFSDKSPLGALVVWNRVMDVTGCIFSSFLPLVLFCCERVSQLLSFKKHDIVSAPFFVKKLLCLLGSRPTSEFAQCVILFMRSVTKKGVH